MIIAGKEYPNANIGDTFWIVETANDRLTDYETKYQICENGKYSILEHNWDCSIFSVSDDTIEVDLEYSQHGIQFCSKDELKDE